MLHSVTPGYPACFRRNGRGGDGGVRRVWTEPHHGGLPHARTVHLGIQGTDFTVSPDMALPSHSNRPQSCCYSTFPK